MYKLSIFLSFFLAIVIVFSLLMFSGVLPFHHFCIVFDDGEEYHIRARVDHDAENILVYKFGKLESIPINNRSYKIHYCDCENSVSSIIE